MQEMSGVIEAGFMPIILGDSVPEGGALHECAAAFALGVSPWENRRSHLGSISGLATTIAVAGTAFNPVLFAIEFERFGNYALILEFSMIVPTAIALTAFWVEIAHRTSSAA
jgi:hypothetical protein